MRLLGIDYGRVHVGLAIAVTRLAEPLEIVKLGDAIERIVLLIQAYKVEAIVIGVSENQMAIESTEFGMKLHMETKLPIFTQDETLSSHETRVKLAKAHKRRSIRESKIDHMVAAHILQDFIDMYPSLDQVPPNQKLV